jgi:hypothetical protein
MPPTTVDEKAKAEAAKAKAEADEKAKASHVVNRCNASPDVVKKVESLLSKDETWTLDMVGPTNIVVVGSVSGYQKVRYKV